MDDGLNFITFRSGSAGNAALLWHAAGGVLLDFAPGCQRDCRETLAHARRLCPGLDTVLVTHAHGDHLNANSLKVMRKEGLKACCHPEAARQVLARCGAEYAPLLRELPHHAVSVGGLRAARLTADHAPGCHTSAYVLETCGPRPRRACFFTDLWRFSEAHLEHARGADLLFVEANHDAGLLALHGHPGSEFHMNNAGAAEFLGQVCAAGRRQPLAVVLGHLSDSCNRPGLPPEAVDEALARRALRRRFELRVAPRSEPGPELRLPAA